MAEPKVWKLGKGYAGITSRGTRIWKKTKAEARKRVGLTKNSNKKKTTRKKSTKKSKGVRRVARKGFNTAKMFSMLRMVSLMAPAVTRVLETGTPKQKMAKALMDYTGYNMDTGTFHLRDLQRGWTPFLATSVVTYGIPKLTSLMRKLL